MESSALGEANRGWVVLALLLAFPSAGFVQKYTGLAGLAAYVLAVVAVVFFVRKASGPFAPWCRRHFRVLGGMILVGLAICFAIGYPIEDSRGPGKSSDRDQGLNLAVTRLEALKTPYYPSNHVAGPLSVLPGSILLATPFVALGNSAYQNWFWLTVFLYCGFVVFRDNALALCLLAVPLGLSPAALYEFISGGDMLSNGIFTAAFSLLALERWSNPSAPAWSRWLSCVLLGVALSSRANFLLLTPLFGAVVWRIAGFRNAFAAALLVTLTAAAITLPFYFNDPAGFTPLMSRQKLAGADHALPWASTAMIGATVLAAGLCALRLLMRRNDEPIVAFFRACTIVTLTPMICTVLISSIVNGHPDFSFMCDRFGLMYVFFALLGWGGRWFKPPFNAI
jgi:hypothetical protein